MKFGWCCGAKSMEDDSKKQDGPKHVEAFIEACPNLPNEDAENLREKASDNRDNDKK